MSMWLATLFAQTLSFSVADSTALQARLAGGVVSLDAETTPAASLSLHTRRVDWTLTYQPTFASYDLIRPRSYEPSVNHTVSASASVGFRRANLTLTETGSYGQQNLRVPAIFSAAPAAPSPEPATDLPAAAQAGEGVAMEPTLILPAQNRTLGYASSTSSAGLSHLLASQLVLSEALSYSVSSGLDADARALYPRQDQVLGGVSLASGLSPVDTLAVGVSGQLTRTADVDSRIVTGGGSWAHQFSLTTSADVGAGAAYTETHDPAGTLRAVLPVANVSLTLQGRRRRVLHTLALSAALAPQVDRITGTIDSRVVGSATGSRTQGRFALFLNTTAVTSLEVNSPERLLGVGGTLGATYAHTEELSTGVSVGGTWQDFAGVQSNAPVWFGGAVLTYRMLPKPL